MATKVYYLRSHLTHFLENIGVRNRVNDSSKIQELRKKDAGNTWIPTW